MDIKDFIKESLLQIVDGITEANAALEAEGASIPTSGVVGDGVLWSVVKDGKKDKAVQFMRVDFDLAVTVTQGDNIKAGGGVSIASLFNAGASSEESNQSQSVSRIKYTIPLELPKLNNKNNIKKKLLKPIVPALEEELNKAQEEESID